MNKTKEVYLNFFIELTFILLSAFWIRMLSCLLSIVILLFVQVFKGCICIIYTEVAGILDLFCATWKHLHLQTFHVFFSNTVGYFTFFHRNLYRGEFCLTNIQFILLSQFMHRINLNRFLLLFKGDHPALHPGYCKIEYYLTLQQDNLWNKAALTVTVVGWNPDINARFKMWLFMINPSKLKYKCFIFCKVKPPSPQSLLK